MPLRVVVLPAEGHAGTAVCEFGIPLGGVVPTVRLSRVDVRTVAAPRCTLKVSITFAPVPRKLDIGIKTKSKMTSARSTSRRETPSCATRRPRTPAGTIQGCRSVTRQQSFNNLRYPPGQYEDRPGWAHQDCHLQLIGAFTYTCGGCGQCGPRPVRGSGAWVEPRRQRDRLALQEELQPLAPELAAYA